MLSGGLRLALLVAAPMSGALLVHELRHRLRLAMAVAVAAVVGCSALAVSVAGGVAGGASVERSFGVAIPGIDLTVRADAASIAVIVIAALASALALPRALPDHERLTGLLLCLAGTATVAVAGNLVLVAAGCEVIATGALLLGGRRGPGFRTTVLLTAVIMAAGLGLLAAAAQLVAQAGSSDLAAIPANTVGGAVAVPWALAGAVLLLSPTVVVASLSRARDWPAVAAAPAGFLVLLRLEQTSGGHLPGNAALMLGIIGAVVALGAARAALRAATAAAAAQAATAVLSAVLVSLFGGDLAGNGFPLAGLFLGLELALLASVAWHRRPTAWSTASAALVALPGGATGAVVLVSLGSIVARGPAGFLQLSVLVAATVAAAVGVARRLGDGPWRWRPLSPGAMLAVVAGVVGGVLPGLALRTIASPLAEGGRPIDLDAGALQYGGAAWAGGYLAVALLLVLAAAASALLLAGDERPAPPVPAAPALTPPRLTALLRLRRPLRRIEQPALAAIHAVDQWLDVQPRLAIVAVAAAVGVLVLR